MKTATENSVTLTATQEDYLEVVLRLSEDAPDDAVRVTDIANELRTKLPTVTRTVRRMTEMGLLEHAHRQRVALSETGRKMARDIRHRHTDLVAFFTDVLGIDQPDAEQDACKIEHGISPLTAQKLHEFLEYFQKLSEDDQHRITAFQSDSNQPREQQFKNLLQSRIRGWRG